MPQNQQRHSEMWWRGHNDALAGDPPSESYYHYYYDYKLAYDQVRRDQRRTNRQRTLAAVRKRLLVIGPVTLLILALAYGAWYTARRSDSAAEALVVPTSTPRPTPRPTLPPPTSTPAPILRVDGFAVVTGTDGVALRAHTKPGTKTATSTRFREGQTVKVLEGPQSADSLEWWRIEADGESGWAAAPYLKPILAPTNP